MGLSENLRNERTGNSHREKPMNFFHNPRMDVAFSWLLQTKPEGMAEIFAHRHVLQVFHSVIFFVSVYMIYRESTRAGSKKSLGYQLGQMNPYPLSIPRKLDNEVRIPVKLEDVGECCPTPRPRRWDGSSNPSKTAYIVKIFKPSNRDGLPDFGGRIIFGHDSLLENELCQGPQGRENASAARLILPQNRRMKGEKCVSL